MRISDWSSDVCSSDLKGDQDVDTIMVAVDDDYDTTAVQNSIEQLLRERRHITGGKQDDFNVFDTKQISETLSGTTQILTALLGAVAAVSLLVGGIGKIEEHTSELQSLMRSSYADFCLKKKNNRKVQQKSDNQTQ